MLMFGVEHIYITLLEHYSLEEPWWLKRSDCFVCAFVLTVSGMEQLLWNLLALSAYLVKQVAHVEKIIT